VKNHVVPNELSQDAINYFLLQACKTNDENSISYWFKYVKATSDVRVLTRCLKELLVNKNYNMILWIIKNDTYYLLHTGVVLLMLVRCNFTEAINLLLTRMQENGIEYQSVINEGLCISTADKNFEITELLVSYGADYTYKDDTPFINATKNGYFYMINLFIEKGADCHIRNHRILETATEQRNYPLVGFLMDKGAVCTLNQSKVLRIACMNVDLPMAKLFIENGADCTCKRNQALRLLSGNDTATDSEKVTLLNLLFEHQASCTDCENEALRNAARLGHLEFLKVLVQHGADISTNEHEALRSAIRNNHFEMVRFLMENGADYSCCNHKALALTVEGNCIEILTYFLTEVTLSNEALDFLVIHSIQMQNVELLDLVLRHYHYEKSLDKSTILAAISTNNVTILTMLFASGAKLTQDTFKTILQDYHNMSQDIMRLLLKQDVVITNEIIEIALQKRNYSFLDLACSEFQVAFSGNII